MSDWRTIEIYATFIQITGELEVVRPDRVSDAVNRFVQRFSDAVK